MFEVVDIDERDKWQSIVSTFDEYDIYYDCSYFDALRQYTKSDVNLFYYRADDFECCYVMQINDISQAPYFNSVLEKNRYFDIETPYGYGGLMAKNFNDAKAADFQHEMNDYCLHSGIVSQFLRFNPLTDNYRYSRNISEISRQKSTVFMDLSNPAALMSDLDSKNRNMVRKAEKNGVCIKIADDADFPYVAAEFKRLYRDTMNRNRAESFYYFDDAYFDKFFVDMQGKFRIFYATYDGKIIAASIVIFNKDNLHYYLSGADRSFMNLAPNNLLLFRAALWGSENGLKKFHLGGGITDNDGLFLFKKAFNKNGVRDFYIGRNVFDKETFDALVKLRKKLDENFDTDRKYMIKYRQE